MQHPKPIRLRALGEREVVGLHDLDQGDLSGVDKPIGRGDHGADSGYRDEGR